MNIKTQITVVVIVLLAMFSLVNRIRKNKLELKYSFLWFALGIGVIVFTLIPELTAWLAKCLGIGQPINLLFFAGFCFSLMIIYALTGAVSRMSVKMKRLTQEMGLLKKEMEELEKYCRELKNNKIK